MKKALLLGAVLGILMAKSFARGQTVKPVFEEEVGSLDVNHDHTHWPSPESIANDLRSDNEEIRLKALTLLGITDDQTHEVLWSQTSPSREIGKRVVIPDQIQLTYASLGEDATRQAIFAVQFGQTTLAAIAISTAKGWERITTFECWCKYDISLGTDALKEFLQLRPVLDGTPSTPQHYELVLRASGGGSGLYVQNEAHFRMHGGELRRIMSFESRRLSGDPTGPTHICQINKRWFYPTQLPDGPGAVLVDGRGTIDDNKNLAVHWSVRDLENQISNNLPAPALKWNQRLFKYERLANATDSCKQRLD